MTTESRSQSCVEVRRDGDSIVVRDSKLGDESPVLRFTPAEWQERLVEIKRGFLPDGASWLDVNTGSLAWGPLEFDFDTWDAFTLGVDKGQFELEALMDAYDDKLSSRGGEKAATGAEGVGDSGGSVPVAAQPEISDELVELVAEAEFDHDMGAERLYAITWADALSFVRNAYVRRARAGLEVAIPLLRRRWEAERAEEPAWGSGPLVDHNPETAGTGSADLEGGQ